MNLQEAFNAIWTHAQKKELSYNAANGICMYRGPNGAKCFVGVLIPDDNYKPIMDSRSLLTVVESLPDIFDRINVFYLKELQKIHDNKLPEDWNKELIAFAETYNLTVPQ